MAVATCIASVANAARDAQADELVALDRLDRALGDVLGRERLLPPAELEPDGRITTDSALSARVDDLRRTFLGEVSVVAHRHWRTPPVGSERDFPGAESYCFAYDRQHAPLALERRLMPESGDPREKGAMLCSSGMAALQAVLQSLAFLDTGARQTIGAFASYYETHSLLRLSNFARRWTRLMDAEALCDAARRQAHPILLIEPVQYNWRLDTVPWDALIEAIAEGGAPPIVILDTTLSGEDRPLGESMGRLRAAGVPLLIRVRSGLKLDQQGLELANLGVVEWWPRPDLASAFDAFARTMRSCRIVTGAGVGWVDACALSPSFVLESADFSGHSLAVLDANRALADRLTVLGDLFDRVVYPRGPWGAPFLFLPLRDGGGTRYRELAAIIVRAARARGLGWTMSGSFGFREERWETIQPEEQLRVGEYSPGILKVAAGSYRGARFEAIARLLSDLVRCDSIADAARIAEA